MLTMLGVNAEFCQHEVFFYFANIYPFLCQLLPFLGFLHYIEKGHLHQINQLSTIKDAHLLSKILPNGKAQKLILSKNSLERVRFDRYMQMNAKLW